MILIIYKSFLSHKEVISFFLLQLVICMYIRDPDIIITVYIQSGHDFVTMSNYINNMEYI